ncbi:hypothetical protein EZV73_07255 [Acidaminobacter sp. JC074]|uniref:hypothetical protein n=1 Tax=Acidaminobacter sp. JC074 TaxID=2530199 RepID=UPI001F0F74F7|nr:hypothetical protein [Acidaminobacter sp. JC074]MCH4887362.1 hypothetical protein [Acidaminobacter sp. JC074]
MIKFVLALTFMVILDYLSQKEYKPLYLEVNSIRVKSYLISRLQSKMALTSRLATFLNVYSLIFIVVMLFIYFFSMSFFITRLLIPSLSMGLLFAVIPIIYLELKEQSYHNQLSLEVTKLISSLTRWAIVKEDVYFCFAKSVDQVEGPLKLYINDFLMQVKYSGHINFAFDHIINFTQHELLRNLMINLQQTAYCKGDLIGILERLEEESYLIFGEHERRKTDTYFDKLAIYFSIICVLVMTVFILTINVRMRSFYLETSVGNHILSVFSLLFIVGVYLASKITSFNY